MCVTRQNKTTTNDGIDNKQSKGKRERRGGFGAAGPETLQDSKEHRAARAGMSRNPGLGEDRDQKLCGRS